MKKNIFLLVIVFALSLTGCQSKLSKNTSLVEVGGINSLNLKLEINGQKVLVGLENNATTKELLKKLPLTITMSELNGNEKFYDLAYSLPSKPQVIKQIHSGDLMLFNDNCLVLFYQDFLSTYRYTKIGSIIDNTDLAALVGQNDIEIKFTKIEMEK